MSAMTLDIVCSFRELEAPRGGDELQTGLFVRSPTRAKATHLRQVSTVGHVAPPTATPPAAVQEGEAAVPAGAQADLRHVRGDEQVGRGDGDRPQPSRPGSPSWPFPLPGRAVWREPPVGQGFAQDAMKEGGGGAIDGAACRACRDECADGAPQAPGLVGYAVGRMSNLAGREPGDEEPLGRTPIRMETLVDEGPVVLESHGIQEIEDEVPPDPSKGEVGGVTGGARRLVHGLVAL